MTMLESEEKLVEQESVFKTEDTSSEEKLPLFNTQDVSKVYLEKSMLVSKAIDDIGFGRYQKCLFIVAGFGWFADNAFPVATSYILQRLNEVDRVHYPKGKAPYLTLAQNLGLLAGAFIWSVTSDIIGRRWAFNFTFLFTALFSLVAGASPNFAAIGVFCSLWSFGVGGNLPVDSTVLLEALPTNKKWLLTVMSIWWSLGQVVTALISWGLISNYSCTDQEICYYSQNKGWRYFLFTLGGITLMMFFLRFFFPVFESPVFFLSRGDNARAIDSLNKIASFNKTTNKLTLARLQELDQLYGDEGDLSLTPSKHKGVTLAKKQWKKYDMNHLHQLFASRKLAISSCLVILTWGLVGLAFPLYNAFLPTILEGKVTTPDSIHITYRNTLIVAVLGIPGSLIAGFCVEYRIGRKGTLCFSCIMTGIVLYGSVTAKSSNSNLAWTCFFSFFSNIIYGVLYAYTPEVFPARVRGTAMGLASSFNRIFGVFAPIIAIYADLTTSAPVYVSGALFLLAGVLVVFFPYEPRNRSSI